MRLTRNFYCRDVLEVAPGLLGKKLVRRSNTSQDVFVITEVEAYRGEEDGACHARFGKTNRNGVMYETGGFVYVYLVYGMYWMFNIVTGPAGHPQAVLIRGLEGIKGPGRLTRELGIDSYFCSSPNKQSHEQQIHNRYFFWMSQNPFPQVV